MIGAAIDSMLPLIPCAIDSMRAAAGLERSSQALCHSLEAKGEDKVARTQEGAGA